MEACQFTTPKEVQGPEIGRKIMATVFWDADGFIMVDYLEKGKTVSGAYYATLLGQFCDRLKEIRRGKLSRVCCFCKTTHRFTRAMLQSSLWLTVVMNCSPTLPILQIWPSLPFICFVCSNHT